ncbi:DUF2628 domain-containing protein [Pasteurellaceae bacterium HPA106]|uniref:DUF2628 domain-containing protein n=1 Tax=Spirabiliibacterium pneumoniae TaxID=221400 RepID=UPI001AADA4AE|nr:DUF2628 domain-containing protein [Spirabiliibacterium pneumoniae]MBE2896274.1 DUF2628 domain-containing protein [Spirabiliibacterium pneumoniae]
MKQFKIYENTLTGEIEAVKQGWSWSAFIFTWIWAFVKKLWLIGAGFLTASIIISIILQSTENESLLLVIFIVNIALWIFIGVKGNEWREANLLGKGFTQQQIIMANNPTLAIAQYVKNKGELH